MIIEYQKTLHEKMIDRAVTMLLQEAGQKQITKWDVMHVASVTQTDYFMVLDLVNTILIDEGGTGVVDIKRPK